MKFQNQRNPILPVQYHVPDAEAHVMPDGKLYVYGSFDNRNDVFCSSEYHVVFTADMKEWEVEDEPSLRGEEIPWFENPAYPHYPGIDWSKPTPFIKKMLGERGEDKAAFEKKDAEKPPLLFAPDCICRDGKYYLYFCMSDDSEGVATADNPKGPFQNPVQLHCGGIDPAIFIDSDGAAYYYWGQLFSHGVKLNDDMISFDKNTVVNDLVTEEEHFFHEGSSMRKIGDTYYYVYADMERGKPTALGYSTSKSSLGPFTYRGIIIDNAESDPMSWNNHGSIECFGGQWYVFYHRPSRNTQQYRRLCVEKIQILPDGTIPEVKMTSQGIGEPFCAGERIFGYQACAFSGGAFIDESNDSTYPEKISVMNDGDTAIFRYVKNEKPWEKATVTFSGVAQLTLFLDGQEAGSAKLSGKNISKSEFPISSVETGKTELLLKFDDVQDFSLFDITLF